MEFSEKVTRALSQVEGIDPAKIGEVSSLAQARLLTLDHSQPALFAEVIFCESARGMYSEMNQSPDAQELMRSTLWFMTHMRPVTSMDEFADVCDDVKQFVSSIGTPHGYDPSTRDLPLFLAMVRAGRYLQDPGARGLADKLIKSAGEHYTVHPRMGVTFKRLAALRDHPMFEEYGTSGRSLHLTFRDMQAITESSDPALKRLADRVRALGSISRQDRFYAAAAAMMGSEGDLEVDADAVISVSSDGGAYVGAFKWVDDSEAGVHQEEDAADGCELVCLAASSEGYFSREMGWVTDACDATCFNPDVLDSEMAFLARDERVSLLSIRRFEVRLLPTLVDMQDACSRAWSQPEDLTLDRIDESIKFLSREFVGAPLDDLEAVITRLVENAVPPQRPRMGVTP